jgi:hypothetical protein
VGPGSFVLAAAIAVAGGYVWVGTRLLDVQGFLMPLNWTIVAFCSGWIVGSVLRHFRPGPTEKA